MAGRPKGGRKRGLHVLKLMQGISPNLHENIVGMWDTVVPKLIQYLEGMYMYMQLKLHLLDYI